MMMRVQLKLVLIILQLILYSISITTLSGNNRDSIALRLLQQKLAHRSNSENPIFQTQEVSSATFEPIPSGKTNFCFKCSLPLSSDRGKSASIFVKLALNRTREYISHIPISLPPTRLRYDYEGMRSFAKYTPQLVPKIYHYDRENHILFLQFLHTYQPLQRLFLSGEVPNDVGKILGTLMGRNHAKTFHLIIPSDQRMKYERIFANDEHRDLWKNNFFTPTLTMIESFIARFKESSATGKFQEKKGTVGRDIQMEYEEKLASMRLSAKDLFRSYLFENQERNNQNTDNPKENRIYQIILKLQEKYLNEKETLIHGDLECSNILYSFAPPDQIQEELPFTLPSFDKKGDTAVQRTVISEYDEDTIQLKIIDFEKCSYGLSGVDLGIFLVNYMWYFLAHSQSSTRKSLMNQIFTVIDCYRSAFQVQFTGSVKQNMMKRRFGGGFEEDGGFENVNANVDEILYGIILDSIGYAGLYLLFASITYPNEFESIFAFDSLPELQFGNNEGRKLFIEQRRMHFLVSLLLLFHRYSENVGSSRNINALLEDLFGVFQQDDQRLMTDHFTEYWY